MTKQELYKRLKQEKLFSDFCIVIANAFWREDDSKGHKDLYIERSIDSINSKEQTIENYLHSVSTWSHNQFCDFTTKIQI